MPAESDSLDAGRSASAQASGPVPGTSWQTVLGSAVTISMVKNVSGEREKTVLFGAERK